MSKDKYGGFMRDDPKNELGTQRPTPTDNAEWLSSVLVGLYKELLPDAAFYPEHASETAVLDTPYQAILTHIDTACREAEIRAYKYVIDEWVDSNGLHDCCYGTPNDLKEDLEKRIAQLNPNKDTK